MKLSKENKYISANRKNLTEYLNNQKIKDIIFDSDFVFGKVKDRNIIDVLLFFDGIYDKFILRLVGRDIKLNKNSLKDRDRRNLGNLKFLLLILYDICYDME